MKDHRYGEPVMDIPPDHAATLANSSALPIISVVSSSGSVDYQQDDDIDAEVYNHHHERSNQES